MLKYNKELYTDSGFHDGDMDDEVENHVEKLVKCRKSHICSFCQKEISRGEYAVRESGFLDDTPVKSYTCTTCIENWLEESFQVDFKNDEGCADGET